MKSLLKRKTIIVIPVIVIIGALIIYASGILPVEGNENFDDVQHREVIELTEPNLEGEMSLEEAILERRSIRTYTEEPLTKDYISQLLWSAQGITDPTRDFRAAPSAGALYPLEVYVVSGKVEGLPKGLYQYNPHEHHLKNIKSEDIRGDLYDAALRQNPVAEAPALIIICAVPERTTGTYGERGRRYVYMEAGHAAQNIYLQATSEDLGTVVIGAFDDNEVRSIMDLPSGQSALYILPVGKTN